MDGALGVAAFAGQQINQCQQYGNPLPLPQPNHHQLQHLDAGTRRSSLYTASARTGRGPLRHPHSQARSHSHSQPVTLHLPFRATHQQLPQLHHFHSGPRLDAASAAQLLPPRHGQHPASQHHSLSMAAGYAAPDDELARLQELSNKWEPEATGPLVSPRIPSSALTQEYANADAAYQVKTASLPQKYAQYRTCRGDGHCGWRAVAFSYYETLLRVGDSHKFLEEETRLKSLQNILKDVGFQEHLYEDFVEETLSLLKETAEATDEGEALLEAFNDFSRSQSIITFLKLLTSAWIQTHPDDYAPYMDLPLVEYCKNRIEPAVCEIEHIGISALVDVLVKPVGIAAEILYLDRSPGDEVTTYRFDPMDQNGMLLQSPPTFRLLYRPGHYDILYKLEDLPVRVPLRAPPANQEVFVAINHGQTDHLHAGLPFAVNDYEIPGMSVFPNPGMNSSAGWPSYPQYDFPQVSHAPGPMPTRSRTVPTTPTAYQIPPSTIHGDFFGASIPIEPQAPAQPVTPVTPVTPSVPQSTHPATLQSGTPFRPSRWEYETNFAPCQTAIFRNSAYNTAHFNNPEFEPEQWQPESEYNTAERSRKKSSSH